MHTALYLLLVSGLVLVVLFFVFKAESIKGRRLFLSTFRGDLDVRLAAYFKDKHHWHKYIGASSLRLLLHFVLHQIISGTLFLIKSAEGRLKKLKRHNRLVAKKITIGGNNHLLSIAKHKEDVALTPEEKEARNERSLND